MDAPDLNARLRAEYDRAEALHDLARRVQRAGLPARPPTVPGVRFGWAHGGSGWFDVARLDGHRAGFWVADPGRSMAGTLLGLALRHAVGEASPPPELLARANRVALDLGAGIAAIGYGLLDSRTGEVSVSRGGVPPAAHWSAGRVELWTGPAPFVGAFDAEFPAHSGRLAAGDKLVLASAAEPTRLADAVAELGRLPVAELAERLRAALATEESPTVLVVEVVGDGPHA